MAHPRMCDHYFWPHHANWPLVIFKIAGCPSTAQHHHQTQNLICARNSQFLAFKCYLNELKFPFSLSNRATSRWISLFISYSQTPTLHVSLNGPRMKKILLHGLPHHPKMDEEILCKLYRQSCKALRKQIKLKR